MTRPALPERFYAVTPGFWRQGGIARALAAAGAPLAFGWPGGPGSAVLTWGAGAGRARGARLAQLAGRPLWQLEEAFLRGLYPGRHPKGRAAGPLGFFLAPLAGGGVPGLLTELLAESPAEDPALLARAAAGLAHLRALDLSKYNLHPARGAGAEPAPGYVLVIDQVRGDAALGGAGSALRALLPRALAEHPEARVLIKTHPETALGLRPGHFGPEEAGGRVQLWTESCSPWALLEGAVAIYTHSSHLGFEAILAGHRPVVAGAPFYAGWGLSEDLTPLPGRGAARSALQLFAAAYLQAPYWFDPILQALCPFEVALDQMEAERRAFLEDRAGYVALGFRAWKKPWLARALGREKPLSFARRAASAVQKARAEGRALLLWGNHPAPEGAEDLRLLRLEDGLLRSRGLGAALTPPFSLMLSAGGLYCDPAASSAIEAAMAKPLSPAEETRAAALWERIKAAGVTKYNLTLPPPPRLPEGPRLLIVGQVAGDASLALGAPGLDERALLRAARAARPDHKLIFKPHPDVAAGLRAGLSADEAKAAGADLVLPPCDPLAVIKACEGVWTLTSLLGFEALLRGAKVTCLGQPFYAGWGLTEDLGPALPRRAALAAPLPPARERRLRHLLHAALITAPRYFAPGGRPASPEAALALLIAAQTPARIRLPLARFGHRLTELWPF